MAGCCGTTTTSGEHIVKDVSGTLSYTSTAHPRDASEALKPGGIDEGLIAGKEFC